MIYKLNLTQMLSLLMVTILVIAALPTSVIAQAYEDNILENETVVSEITGKNLHQLISICVKMFRSLIVIMFHQLPPVLYWQTACIQYRSKVQHLMLVVILLLAEHTYLSKPLIHPLQAEQIALPCLR